MATNPNPPLDSIADPAAATPAAVDPQLLDSLRLELRRGCLVVAVLAQLREEHYGYTLRKALADQGLAIEESTLYPLLRRLESQALLTSQWREEDRRNKRFYRLSPAGEATLAQLLTEWRGLNASLEKILDQIPHRPIERETP
jgi:PadR family transcriptional regulator, regulatory protein PadR